MNTPQNHPTKNIKPTTARWTLAYGVPLLTTNPETPNPGAGLTNGLILGSLFWGLVALATLIR